MIKLGMIGMSEGNGHPYSWGAIINGFNKDSLGECPFPSIPQYLSRHSYDHNHLDAKVTSIWTQSKQISNSVAKFSNIERIEKNLEDMIPHIDGILLARDDYQSHLKYAKPFIEAGLPIYIDKPLAVNFKSAEKILDLEKFKGQIFSASSFVYHPSIQDVANNISEYGNLKFFNGIAGGPWDRYAIHLIDPLLKIHPKKFDHVAFSRIDTISTITLRSKSFVANISCLGGITSPLRLTLVGEKKYIEVDLLDPYYAFKNTLEVFINNILSKKIIRSKHEILSSIKLIEHGIEKNYYNSFI